MAATMETWKAFGICSPLQTGERERGVSLSR
jgi:hypothetical protein